MEWIRFKREIGAILYIIASISTIYLGLYAEINALIILLGVLGLGEVIYEYIRRDRGFLRILRYFLSFSFILLYLTLSYYLISTPMAFFTIILFIISILTLFI